MDDDGRGGIPAGSEDPIAGLLPEHLLNHTNKDLTEKFRTLEEKLESVNRQSEQHKDKLKLMVEHLVNVKNEITNTQALYEGKRRELETEDHLTQIADREVGRISQELSKMVNQQAQLQDGIDNLQNAIFQGNLRMDEFKAAMNFNQEELEQWDIARRQKEDDCHSLQNYTKSDDVKLKELNLQIEKLSQQVQAKRRELEREVTLTQASQIELHKAAEDYKALHRERQELLTQWDEAVKAMHRRDEAIQQAGERYADGKQWLQKRTDQLKSRAKFHNLESQNNKDAEIKITKEERVLTKYRADHATIHQHITELDDELEVVKNTLAKAVSTMHQKGSEKQELNNQLEQKNAQLARHTTQLEKLSDKMMKEAISAKDLEKQNKLVAELLSQTEQSMKALDAEMTTLKDKQYHTSQELFNVRRQQATYLAEISGAQAQNNNMLAKISQLDQEGFKQQELLYNIEFQVQQMERKVNRARGERTEEEKRELVEKISMLQRMLDDLMKQFKVLELQVKRVNDEVRQSHHRHTDLEKLRHECHEKVLELALQNESSTIEMNHVTKEKEDALVHSDVLLLEVKRLQKLLHSRNEELSGLQNRSQQLELTVAERIMEISVHHEMIRMESKLAEEERRKVANELQERDQQVQHLKNRYIVLIGRIQREDGDTAEISHAQYIVNTAKEREQLQQRGDTLDEEIKGMEREGRKLDRTMAMLKGANVKYKHMFVKVGEDDDEVSTKTLLQQKNKEVQSVVNRRTAEMAEYVKTEVSKMNELQERMKDMQGVQQKVAQSQQTKEGLFKEIDEQREYAARYDVAVTKIKRGIDADIVNDVLFAEERDRLSNFLGVIHSAVSAESEDATRDLDRAVSQLGISLPSPSQQVE
jgi:chromosome segregation ATPase